MYNGLNFNAPRQQSYFDSLSSYDAPNPSDFSLTSAPNYAPKLVQGLNMNPNALPVGVDMNAQGGGGLFGGMGDWLKNSGVLGSQSANGMKTDGWGGLALSTVSGLMNAYMGMKQYGLAKKTLAHNKDQFAKNYAAQKQTTNAAFEDRQRARVASNAGAYESVGDYMKKNAIA